MPRLSPFRSAALPLALAAVAAGADAARAQQAPAAPPKPAAPVAPDTAAQYRAEDRAARRGFADSWFWGAKTGAYRFGTITGNKIAPLVGADWMITRSRAAVLVSAEQAFFSHTSAVPEPGRPGFGRVVSLRDARRFSATVLAAPGVWKSLRPYAGLGMALDVLREAAPQGTFASMAQRAAVQDEIDDGASKASLVLMGGAQKQFGRTAVFAQLSGSPAQTRSLWNSGGTLQFELGARYNLSRAIER